MSTNFYDNIDHSAQYAQSRPTYPAAIMDTILAYLSLKYTVEDNDLAIDIGCGTGQSTTLLAPHFRQVIGYDISESQIAKAIENNIHANINYKVITGTDLPHANSSLTLIICGQAAQWLDLPRFYAEARRTLKTNGVLALFGYAFVQIHGRNAEKLNEIVLNFYQNTLAGYVQQESVTVYFDRYRDKQFHIPLSSSDFVRDESITIECQWSIRRFLGYIASWSAYQYFLKQHPENTILDELRSEIFKCLDMSNDDFELELTFDTFILMNRKC